MGACMKGLHEHAQIFPPKLYFSRHKAKFYVQANFPPKTQFLPPRTEFS
jgi:hypothetical protein